MKSREPYGLNILLLICPLAGVQNVKVKWLKFVASCSSWFCLSTKQYLELLHTALMCPTLPHLKHLAFRMGQVLRSCDFPQDAYWPLNSLDSLTWSRLRFWSGRWYLDKRAGGDESFGASRLVCCASSNHSQWDCASLNAGQFRSRSSLCKSGLLIPAINLYLSWVSISGNMYFAEWNFVRLSFRGELLECWIGQISFHI